MPRTPINYQNTIIYKIVCNDLNIKDLYVGHTTDFKRRKNEHKYASHKEDYKSYNAKLYQTIRECGGWDNWSMIEIEKYPCSDTNEATARERYWFELLESKMNSFYPQRSGKEYYENNKDKIKEVCKKYQEANKDKIHQRSKKYYEENKDRINKQHNEYYAKNKDKIKEYTERNKDKIKERDQQKIVCECGSVFCRGDKARHYKTKKHKSFIEEKEI